MTISRRLKVLRGPRPMQTRMQSLSSAVIVPGASSLMRKTVNVAARVGDQRLGAEQGRVGGRIVGGDVGDELLVGQAAEVVRAGRVVEPRRAAEVGPVLAVEARRDPVEEVVVEDDPGGVEPGLGRVEGHSLEAHAVGGLGARPRDGQEEHADGQHEGDDHDDDDEAGAPFPAAAVGVRVHGTLLIAGRGCRD